jgi:uncharacterized protein YcfJ
MKQSVLIASVLGGGVALGAAGLAGYQALHRPAAPGAASQPVAVAARTAPTATSAPTASSAAAIIAANSQAPAKTASAAAAQPAATHDSYAKVLSVHPITTTVDNGSRTRCHQEQVVRQKPVQDENRITGTVIGGVLGGVLGHQVGSGHGNDAATVVGALAGGYAGNKVQQNMQHNDTYTDTQSRCEDVAVHRKKIIAYQVRYSLDGKTGSVRMTHRPGKRIPAHDGQLQVD